MNLETFFESYVETALWSSTDDNGDPLDENYDDEDISEESRKRMWDDCEAFMEENEELLEDWPTGDAAHNFWLTRNRHGAGFWDSCRGTEEQRKALTEASHLYGETDLYLRDDGKLHLS